MRKKLSVGIDVSKYTLDVAITFDGVEIIQTREVANEKNGYHRILNMINSSSSHDRVHICMEATGVHSIKVREYFQAMGYLVSEVNPSVIRSFRHTSMVRTKTDPIDAKLIAIYCYKMTPRSSQIVPTEKKELKKHTARLNYLIERLAMSKTYISSFTDIDIRKSEKRIMDRLEKEIFETNEKLKDLILATPNLKRDHELLTSIPGVGKKTAAIVMSELINEDTSHKQRYTKKCQSAHAGLAPAQHQSGVSVNGRPYICKSGNSMLRKSLYFPTMSAIRHNPIIKAFYQKLVSKGKRKIVALVACMRKLLMIMIGVLNTGIPFEQDWVSKPYYSK